MSKYYPRRYKVPSRKSATFPLKNKNDINLILSYFLQKRDHAKSEIKKFQAHRNYMLCLLGFNTAFRCEDLIQLFGKDVSRGFINIIEFKTRKSQVFKLNKKLYDEILEYINKYEIKDHDYLFPKKPHGTKPITRQRVDDILEQVSIDIKLNRPFSAHSMRKTFAYHKYLETGDIFKIMRMLNHSEPATTLIYICWDSSDAENEREQTYFGLI